MNTNLSPLPSQKTTVFIYGLTGKMGKEISDLILESSTLHLAGGSSSKLPSPLLPSDVAIDFSHRDSLIKHLNEATQSKIPLMIGTTGLIEEDHKDLQEASKNVPILYAANTSLGIAVMTHLVKEATKMLDESYDIEIFETHHRHKTDAPSGTALALGKAISICHNQDSNPIIGERQGSREKGKIGYAVQRGGGVFGDHSMRFIGDEEIIEVSHRSLSRRLFARGALKAALWLKDQGPGLYTMDDMLKK